MLLYFVFKVTTLVGNIITFYKGNEWASDGNSVSTFHMWLPLLSCCVCLHSLPTKYHSYLLKLISICGNFLTDNHRYDCCYVKGYTTVYFSWILHSSRGKFSKIVSKCFQVFKGFKYYVFKNMMNVVNFQPIEPP